MKPKIPSFRTDDEERDYWATHSAAEFIETLPTVEIEIVAPRHKREQIALPAADLEAIKRLAKRKGVPHKRLIQMWLRERLKNETGAA